MKLSRHAFTRFWDVHAWVGVVTGLVLHVMFFAGAFALFYEDLSFWQERTPRGGAMAGAPVAPLVDRTLRERGVQPEEVSVSLPGERTPFLVVGWLEKDRPEWAEIRLDPSTGAVVAESSHLATILYWLHFLYHPKAAWGMYVAGLFGVALLLALVTGVLIHWKDIVRQFHQFRPAKAARVLWSDLHKVLGVMGLPFQTMVAFTGAVICLASLLLMVLTGPVFGGDAAAATGALWGGGREVRPTGRAASTMDLDHLLTRARMAVPGFQPMFVRVSHLGDEAATARVWGKSSGRLFGRGDVVLRATDGALLSESLTRSPTPGMAFNRWVIGLHYALYGGLAAKVLYALLAAATCLTILSGNWIWLLRREARASSAGNRLLARLTTGVGGGILLGAACLFWANRLAPASVRMAAESWAFFGVWGLTAGLFLLRADSRTGWVGLLRISGGAFALLPVASALATEAHLFNVGHHGRLDVFGVEVGLVLLGLGLLLGASIVDRRARAADRRQGRLPFATPATSRQEA
jgi:uncharacterized iron-regulated membrane protein